MSDKIQGQIDAIKTALKIIITWEKGKGTMKGKLELFMIGKRREWFLDKTPEYIEAYNDTLQFFIDVEPGEDPVN